MPHFAQKVRVRGQAFSGSSRYATWRAVLCLTWQLPAPPARMQACTHLKDGGGVKHIQRIQGQDERRMVMGR